MQRKQTAEQAAAMDKEYFKGRCIARVTDIGNRVTFEIEGTDSIDATGDQVFDVERFKKTLENLEDAKNGLIQKQISHCRFY